MIAIFILVLLALAIRGVVIVYKGEVVGKDFAIRGAVARFIGICYVSSFVLFFLLLSLETAIFGATKNRDSTTFRLLITAVIAIIIGLASAELLKKTSGGKIKSPSVEKPKAKRDVGDAVGTLKAKGDVEGLAKALTSGESGVPVAAARALGTLGAPAVEPLITALKNEDSDVRQAAVTALGSIGDARAVEPLIAAFNDPDGAVRAFTATALGEIGGAHVVEPLITALENRSETNWVVHTRAAKALGEIGDARAVEPLIAALEYGVGSYGAAEALGKIGDTRAVEPLIAALGDRDATLRNAMLSESEANLRQSAAEALAKFGDARAVEPLIDALGGRYKVNRNSAAVALGEIGSLAVEPLFAAVTTKPKVSSSTVKELRELGDAHAVERNNDEKVSQIVEKAARELADRLPMPRSS